MNGNITQETLDLMKTAQSDPQAPSNDLLKAFTAPSTSTTGLQGYDLEAPSKKLYPLLTPLRNRIARIGGGFSIQANWKAVTGINTSGLNLGVAEGRRGGVISQTTADYFAKFVGLGLENNASFESVYAGKSFEDIRALAVTELLQAVMIGEEMLDLGGCGVTAINGGNACPTPTLGDIATGGSLNYNTAYKLWCIPLTLQGYQQVAQINNGRVGDPAASANFATGFSQQISRPNADGTTETINGGLGKPSLAATITTANDSNATHGVSATVAPVAGAVAYAWYFGTSAGSQYLGAVTTINSVVFNAVPSSSNQAFSALTSATTDYSVNGLVYDGLLTQLMKSNSGAYFVDLATGTAGTGSKLTSDGAGGINEVSTALQSFYDNYRLSPDEMYVGSQVLLDMNAIVIANGGAPLYRFNVDGNKGGVIDAGVVLGSLLNKITNTAVKVLVHPNMPPGMIMFWSNSVPYPLNDVGPIIVKHCRQDYYQLEWPLKTRKYEYGVYFDGVLKNYFPPAYGVIRNIAPGH